MTGADFIAWRAMLGISRAEACRRLGIHPNSVTVWEKGEREIPKSVALACSAVAKKLKPWPPAAKSPKEPKP